MRSDESQKFANATWLWIGSPLSKTLNNVLATNLFEPDFLLVDDLHDFHVFECSLHHAGGLSRATTSEKHDGLGGPMPRSALSDSNTTGRSAVDLLDPLQRAGYDAKRIISAHRA